jgi:citrate lyase synthetase
MNETKLNELVSLLMGLKKSEWEAISYVVLCEYDRIAEKIMTDSGVRGTILKAIESDGLCDAEGLKLRLATELNKQEPMMSFRVEIEAP